MFEQCDTLSASSLRRARIDAARPQEYIRRRCRRYWSDPKYRSSGLRHGRRPEKPLNGEVGRRVRRSRRQRPTPVASTSAAVSVRGGCTAAPCGAQKPPVGVGSAGRRARANGTQQQRTAERLRRLPITAGGEMFGAPRRQRRPRSCE
jgi:hypothetical protein